MTHAAKAKWLSNFYNNIITKVNLKLEDIDDKIIDASENGKYSLRYDLTNEFLCTNKDTNTLDIIDEVVNNLILNGYEVKTNIEKYPQHLEISWENAKEED